MQELSMNHRPDLETFSALAAENQLIPVYRTLLSDGLTPVSAFQRLDQGGSVCLFESVIGGEKIGRFSILATDPFMEIHASGQQVTLVQGEERKTYH
jgi:anthranilate synthase component 1